MSKVLSLPLLACLLAAGFTGGCGNRERDISGQIFIVTKGSQNVKLGLVAVHVLTDAQIKAASEQCFNRENTFTTRGFEAISVLFFDSLPPAITKSDADGQFTVRAKGKTWLLARSSRKVGSDDEAYVWAVPTEGQPPKLLLSNDNHFNDLRAFITFLQQIPGGFEPVSKAEAEAKKAAEEQAAAEWARIAAEALLATAKRMEWTGKAMRRAGFTAEQVTQTLTQGGTVVAWKHGQTTIPPGLSGVVAIAAGYGHSLALKSDGTVLGWGINDNGQTTIPSGLIGVTAIAAGSHHSLAIKIK